MRKKLFIYILITFFCILPISSYAWDEIGVYAPYDGSQQVYGCSSIGNYNYGQNNIYWSVSPLSSNVSYAQSEIFIAHKYDLAAQTYYDVHYYFKNNSVKKALTSSRIKIYTGDNCGTMTQTNDIALISIKTDASSSTNGSYLRVRFFTSSIVTNWGIYIDGRNANGTSTKMTTNNWYISKAVLRTVDMSGTKEIVENQNNNTNNIINNQNENTQDIINNQNQNTQDTINSQMVCSETEATNNGYFLNSSGGTSTSSTWKISDYINVENAKLKVITPVVTSATTYYCFYDVDKTKVSCSQSPSSTGDVTIPTGAVFLRYSALKSNNRPVFQVCKNGNQSINETFTDSSIPSGNDYFDDFNDMLPSNNTISSLITLPISLYTKVLNSINGTCSSINLGSLYNTNLVMPCINLETYLGSTLFGVIDLIMSGGFVLIISKKMVKAFHNFTSMKDGDVINND